MSPRSSSTADTFIPEDEYTDISGTAATDDEDTVLNLSDVDENANPNLLPGGTYDGRIADVTFGSSSKGNKMFTYVGEIPHPEKVGKTIKVWYYTTLSDDDTPRTKKTLRRINPEVESMFARFRPSEVIPLLIGRPVRFKIKPRMYEGSMRNNVTEILAPNAEGLGFLSEPS